MLLFLLQLATAVALASAGMPLHTFLSLSLFIDAQKYSLSLSTESML
jgi:hypothetical protein